MDLVRVKDLTLHYINSRAKKPALNDVNLIIRRGDVASIVGASGSGKSTLALSIAKLMEMNPVKWSGSIFFEEDDITNASYETIKKIRREDIGFVFQEPSSSLNPVFSIKKQLLESCRKKSLEDVIQLMKQVGLQDTQRILQSYPHELSGGMLQRIMIVMALIKSPKLLIADEPTTALDATVQKEILKLLIQLKERNNLTLLFITHDLYLAKAISNIIYIMQDGCIVEEFINDDKTEFKHEYSKKLFSSAMLSMGEEGK